MNLWLSHYQHDWTTSGRGPGRVRNLPGKPLVVPAAASSAAQDLQQTPAGVALMALQWVWPELWLDPQQTSGEAAPLVSVASVAAQDPQLTPDGATLVAVVMGNYWQALCGAALVTLVALGQLHRGCLGPLQHWCHL